MIGGAIGARALADGGGDPTQSGKRGEVIAPLSEARGGVARRESARVVARAGEKQSWV